MRQLGDGSGIRATASADADDELHDDDELAAVIAAQIQSYTSTAPLPVIDPRNDPRLRPLTFADADADADAEADAAASEADAADADDAGVDDADHADDDEADVADGSDRSIGFDPAPPRHAASAGDDSAAHLAAPRADPGLTGPDPAAGSGPADLGPPDPEPADLEPDEPGRTSASGSGSGSHGIAARAVTPSAAPAPAPVGLPAPASPRTESSVRGEPASSIAEQGPIEAPAAPGSGADAAGAATDDPGFLADDAGPATDDTGRLGSDDADPGAPVAPATEPDAGSADDELDDDLDAAEATQSLPIAVAADRTPFRPFRPASAAFASRTDPEPTRQQVGETQDGDAETSGGPERSRFTPPWRRSVPAKDPEQSPEPSVVRSPEPSAGTPAEPPPTEPISVQLRTELAPLERVDLPAPLVDAGPMVVPAGLYEEWERTLRRIGQPAADDAPSAGEDRGTGTGSGTGTVETGPGVAVHPGDPQAERDDSEAEAPDPGRSDVDPEDGPIGPVAAEPRDASVRSLTRPDILAPPEDRVQAEPATEAPPADDEWFSAPPVLPAAELGERPGEVEALGGDSTSDRPQPDVVIAQTSGGILEEDVVAGSAEAPAAEAPLVQEHAVEQHPPRDAAAAATVAVASASPVASDRRGSWPGLLAGLLGWATVLVSAPILLLGLLLGGTAVAEPATAALGMGVGALLALPGSLRLANRAGAPGGVVGALRRLLGPPVGTAASVLLVVARVLAIGLLLLATDELAAAFITRTGVLPALPGGVTAVLAVLAVTSFGLIGALFRSRAATTFVGVIGFLGVVITVLLVALLASADGIRSGGGPDARPLAAVAAAVFAVVVLLLGGGPGSALARIALPGSRWTALVGAVIGALVAGAVWVAVVQVASDGGIGAVAADTLVGGVVDATAVQLAIPVGLAALVAVAAGVAVLARTGGDLLAGLVRVPGSRGPAGAAVALASVAVALGLVAAGVGTDEFIGRFAPIVLVPLAALAGFTATAPSIVVRPGGRVVAVLGLLLATAVGLLAVDGLVVGAERGPLLAAVGVTGTPLAIGLGAALVVGALTGLVVLITGRPGPVVRPARAADADTVA